MRLSDRPHRLDATKRARAIDRREIERRAARTFGPARFLLEFAAEQATGERAPHHDAQALIQGEGNDLPLELAAGDRVVSLNALEAVPTLTLGDAERFHHLPRGMVGHADVAHFA